MSDYNKVEEALAGGAEPAMLCQTCPWDRYCITPPDMTKADVDAKIAEANEQDKSNAEKAKAEGKEAGLPVGMLLTTVTLGGRHRTAQCCPVLVVRLRSSRGREVVDQIKTSMASWDDNS